MSIFPKKRARIVRDSYSGFEVQIWRWWFPVWLQGEVNTHSTIADAEKYAINRLNPFIKEVSLEE